MTNVLRLTLVLALQTPSAQGLAGTWTANLHKSQRDANHQFSEATMQFEVSARQVTLVYSGINQAGRRESATTIFEVDGREHPAPGAPDIMTIARWRDRVLETVATRNGVEIGRGSYEPSEDGMTLTATVTGTDARGRRFAQVIVFDRAKTP
jgi:hypothetical protein